MWTSITVTNGGLKWENSWRFTCLVLGRFSHFLVQFFSCSWWHCNRFARFTAAVAFFMSTPQHSDLLLSCSGFFFFFFFFFWAEVSWKKKKNPISILTSISLCTLFKKSWLVLAFFICIFFFGGGGFGNQEMYDDKIVLFVWERL